ncbi:WYL domain-containing protein [Limnohabitans sp.]|uniref:helix-turn-helix transcriptional regulator n=1 Tax=Limnohabitans sp. TaxID=1907725 RepID=UPI00286F8A57|nr:WYL domain-containing protein [Limnohabitans sp.]
MNRTERFYKINQLLCAKQAVSPAILMHRLEVSYATLKRDIAYMRDRLNAPIVWDRDAGGYRLAANATQVGEAYQLPGLWFSAAQLYALLAAHKIFSDMVPSTLNETIDPLREQIARLLATSGHKATAIEQRVFLLSMAKRQVTPPHFQQLTTGLLERQQIEVQAWSRSRNETRTRTISPQRLVHYRDNWYVDAWCHWRQALRSFAVETLLELRLLNEPAHEVSANELKKHFSSTYGIFSGTVKDWAVLRFAPERARWVSSEQWHPEQQGQYLADGSYELRLPFGDARELLMDVMRHGHWVEVMAPQSLREMVRDELKQLSRIYKNNRNRLNI